MRNRHLCIAVFFLSSALLFLPHTALCLEEMDTQEMRSLTGQAGISIGAGNALFYFYTESTKIQDVGTVDRFGNPLSPDGYIVFDLSAHLVADDTFAIDVGVFNQTDPLVFTDQMPAGPVTRSFEHPLNNTGMVFFSHLANEPDFNFSMRNMAVYNHGLAAETAIGDLAVSDIRLAETRMHIYPPDGAAVSGIRAIAGTRMQAASVAYANPDQAVGPTVSGTMIGAAFTGDPLPEGPGPENQLDVSTWAFDAGLFRVGIPYYFHDDPAQEDINLACYPFTLDITTDETRPGDFQSYMALNAPVQGAIRIQNISSGSFDMGAIAVDGMRLYKNYIEFPGRGIGN